MRLMGAAALAVYQPRQLPICNTNFFRFFYQKPCAGRWITCCKRAPGGLLPQKERFSQRENRKYVKSAAALGDWSPSISKHSSRPGFRGSQEFPRIVFAFYAERTAEPERLLAGRTHDDNASSKALASFR